MPSRTARKGRHFDFEVSVVLGSWAVSMLRSRACCSTLARSCSMCPSISSRRLSRAFAVRSPLKIDRMSLNTRMERGADKLGQIFKSLWKDDSQLARCEIGKPFIPTLASSELNWRGPRLSSSSPSRASLPCDETCRSCVIAARGQTLRTAALGPTRL